MSEATRKGAAKTKEQKAEPKGPQPDLARFNQVEEIAQHLREQRESDINSRRNTDPGFKAMDDAMNAELDEPRQEASDEEEPEDEFEGIGEEDAEEVEEDQEELEASSEEEDDEAGDDEEDDEEPVKAKKGDDPTAEFIVMENGKPMFRAKVDGKTKLIPLDRAQAQLQKHEAAETRLQEAAKWKRHLEEREQALSHNERVFRNRIEEMRRNAPPSQKPDVDEKALREEARELIGTMFSGTEEEAAEKLVKVLAHRAPANQAPAINVDEISRRAAEEAQRRIRGEQVARDSKEGYDKFSSEYPDILADPYLFKVADGMTDEIAQEHPEWMPSKVMLEAGKRTREWWKKEQAEEGEPSDSKPRKADLQSRQSRKTQLKTMPRPATRRPSKKPEARPQTPQDVIREMREARNQPL